MKISPPWYFCCGWWSPWCFLDEQWHRWFAPIRNSLDDVDDDGFDWADAMDTSEPEEAGWLCRRHDRAAEAYYYKRHPEDAQEDGYVFRS